jgi:DNA-binding CsgD family transcriptional regulator
MMKTPERLKLRDVRAIFRMVGELREMGADPNVWRPHMCQQLRQIVHAHVVVSSEVHFRTTGKSMRMIDIGWGVSEEGQTWQIHTEREDEKPENYWLLAAEPSKIWQEQSQAGEAVVPVKPAKKVYGGKAFIMSQYPLPHLGAVDQLGLHRAWGEAVFTTAEHRLVRLLHVELGRLWRRDVLRKAKDPTTDLPPRLAQTLAELLQGRSEKEIARRLELSRHTIHNYVKALHQRLGVSSRGELLALAGSARADFIPRLSMPPGGEGRPPAPHGK